MLYNITINYILYLKIMYVRSFCLIFGMMTFLDDDFFFFHEALNTSEDFDKLSLECDAKSLIVSCGSFLTPGDL